MPYNVVLLGKGNGRFLLPASKRIYNIFMDGGCADDTVNSAIVIGDTDYVVSDFAVTQTKMSFDKPLIPTANMFLVISGNSHLSCVYGVL